MRGESILLIDETWTTGASVQSAAAALKTAGGEPSVRS
jgi:orotate phosphoribosyltransferase